MNVGQESVLINQFFLQIQSTHLENFGIFSVNVKIIYFFMARVRFFASLNKYKQRDGTALLKPKWQSLF